MSTLLKVMVIGLLACLGLLFFGHLFLEHNSDTALSQVILRHYWAFVLLRYGIYASCILLWPCFIRFVAVRQQWGAECVRYLTNQRLKLLGFFICIEVFFVYNLLGHVFMWSF